MVVTTVPPRLGRFRISSSIVEGRSSVARAARKSS